MKEILGYDNYRQEIYLGDTVALKNGDDVVINGKNDKGLLTASGSNYDKYELEDWTVIKIKGGN